MLLDEPAAGLDDTETAELALVIRRLADEWGMGVLLVEHNLDMVLAVSDHITVLDGGTVLTAGTPAAIATDVRVAAAYVGDTDEKDTLDMHAIETPSHAHPTVGSPR